ncbi:MAG: LolA family protein [Bacteroidia bacterium]
MKLVLYSVIVILMSFIPSANVEKLSLDMVARTLYKGKSITIKGQLFYKVQGGLMVTRIISPMEQIVIANATGEFKSYDVKSNSVTLMQGIDFSSKNSFIYNFLSGNINDMGLTSLGYKLKDTKIDGKIVVSTYMAPTEKIMEITKVEIAHENYLPIFMGFYDNKGNKVQKIYYTNYQNVSHIKMPFTITEIEFLGPQDSTITRRTYSNLKVNEQVDNTWFNYQIPANAKINSANPTLKTK